MPISIAPYVPSLLVQVQSPANLIQTFDGPPPCPANIKQADWDNLLNALHRDLSLEIWTEAIVCGFSKTPMGRSMGWFWHNILIERFSLTHLPSDDYLRLSQLLDLLWTEHAENPCHPLDEEQQYESADSCIRIRQENYALLHSIHESSLGKLIQIICESGIGKRWSYLAITNTLICKLQKQLPLISVKFPPNADTFREKITRLLTHVERMTRAKTTCQPWQVHITEPAYEQIKTHLWEHMKRINRDRPDADVFEIIKTWDEIDAATAAFNRPLADDLLSRFCDFAEIADYR